MIDLGKRHMWLRDHFSQFASGHRRVPTKKDLSIFCYGGPQRSLIALGACAYGGSISFIILALGSSAVENQAPYWRMTVLWSTSGQKYIIRPRAVSVTPIPWVNSKLKCTFVVSCKVPGYIGYNCHRPINAPEWLESLTLVLGVIIVTLVLVNTSSYSIRG
jgi:hypothetical protein